VVLNPHTSKNIHIFNVYNEVITDTLPKLTDVIRKLDLLEETIVLQDFNLHYPLWSTVHHRAGTGPSTQLLLTIIEDFQL
jgi:hypothetical protein